jgi:hypothetical protein
MYGQRETMPIGQELEDSRGQKGFWSMWMLVVGVETKLVSMTYLRRYVVIKMKSEMLCRIAREDTITNINIQIIQRDLQCPVDCLTRIWLSSTHAWAS